MLRARLHAAFRGQSRRPAIPTLSPYTTLFRSDHLDRLGQAVFEGRTGVDAGQRLLEGSRVERLVKGRSEEHTSELQSRGHLVCRLLLEKKKHPHPRDEGQHAPAGSLERPLPPP